MPFMEEDSNDSDGSSQSSALSPQSTATDATSVGNNRESQGCQKRKRNAVDLLPCKRSRVEPCSDGNAFQMATLPGGTTTKMPCIPQKDEMSDPSAHSDTSECGSLPTSVWTSVFMYLPPRSLGALLSVNSVFHRLLTGSSPMPGGGHFSRDTVHKDAEKIWKMARQRHHPHLPRPLHGYRELDMWKLIGASQCQFCVQSLGSPSQYPLGHHLTYQKTIIYWPLAVRSCQNCLGKHFSTESELLSSQLSYLIPSMNYASVKDPLPSIELGTGSKVFLRSHMEWLHAETSRITQKTSKATAESWLKTYEMNARKRQRDAARWERWGATNGRAKLFPQSRRQVISGASSPASSCRSSPSPLTGDSVTQPPTSMYSTATYQEAQSKKAARVQELIKRAAELDPPISFKVLRHTTAYQVAQHITHPLDDFEWSTLRVRLQEQRQQAAILAEAELSDSPSSPQSDTSTMSKNKNKKRKNRLSNTQRGQANQNQGAPSATGANAMPTGGPKASGPNKPASGAAVVAASMSLAAFNQQSQRIVTSNGLQRPMTIFQPSSVPAAHSTAAPLTTAANPAGSLGVAGATNNQPSAVATTSAAPLTSNTSATVATTQIERPRRQTIRAPVPAAATLNPNASRQSSIHPIKIESDESEPHEPSRAEQLDQHVYRPEAESLRQLETSRRSRYDAAQYHDHARPRSRSPPGERRHLTQAYRERDYPQVRRNVLSTYPPTAISHVAPLRGGHEHFYDYPVQPPAARYVPHVLYDEYGNEYVRTAPRESTPYVLYPPPPARGY